MSGAREALSPLIKSAQTRRLSLELCTKIGGQFLNTSPCKSPHSPGQNEEVKPSHWLTCSSASPSYVTPVRRASLTGALNGGNRRRGSELISGDLTKSIAGNSHGPGGKRRSSLVCGVLQPLPTINIEAFSPSPSASSPFSGFSTPGRRPSLTKTVESLLSSPSGSIKTLPTPSRILFTDEEDGNEENTPPSACPMALPRSRRFGRRKSSCFEDFEEEFVSFVSKSLKLELLPEEILGRGSFGTVIGGVYHRQPVAVKVINTKRRQRRESMRREGNAQSLPRHPNIAQIIDIVVMGHDSAFIIMEKLRKGNLGSILNDHQIPIDLRLRRQISSEIASALGYCHSRGILHLDVKPQNILVDHSGHCKLSDFGNSRRMSELGKYKDFNEVDGTVAYKAPELFKGTRPTEKADVYSLAITMWQILARRNPYPKESEHSIIYKVVAHNLRPSKLTEYENSATKGGGEEEEELGLKYIQLYEQGWHSDPNHRPTIQHIIESLLDFRWL